MNSLIQQDTSLEKSHVRYITYFFQIPLIILKGIDSTAHDHCTEQKLIQPIKAHYPQ